MAIHKTAKVLARACALALFLPVSLQAQEYFRALGSSADLAVVQAPKEQNYNFTLGSSAGVNISAGLALEYNDNINLATSSRRESDFIIRPSVQADATWRISDLNTLRFSIGLSYAKYASHSEFDTLGVLLSPNSAIAMTIQAGPLSITLRDRFSYQEDPFDLPVLSGVADYRRLENTAGIQVDWPLTEKAALTVGYDHYNLWTFDDKFKELERAIETVYARPSYMIGQNVTIGANLSASYIHYLHAGQNDGENYMAGFYLGAGLSRSTHVDAEIGYQDLTFEKGGAILDNSDSSSWYARAEVSHQLTEYFSHHLLFSKNSELGFGENFYTLYHAEYGADWRVLPELTLIPTLFYEHYETHGVDPEKADRYGAALGARWVVASTVTLGLDYRFLLKDSNLPDLGYRQNMVLLSAFYNF